MEEHIRILTDNAIIVNRIVQLLDDQGLTTLIKDNVESARLAGFGSSTNNVDLYVDSKDKAKAAQVITLFFDKNKSV